ncbi:TM0106 family RecB-like putative nuclease [Roseomonas sp. KE2513]|uniref:TM0106 family RecB-like putative nuclease n=1 Tax=Roseomonas sp. KE2513 TaxID=2479202 RepID=UPI0018DF48D0|nr:TM0106 family RecB-like putative nuclease [Roseomonas sp. KE2513]MBI0537729.1 TM0106 family RecB-like putative nuclease [Roseomonas sp. KE2513]
MRLNDQKVLLSASDLNVFLGCRHASSLDFRRSILGEALQPATADEGQELIQRRGDDHERRYFEALRAGAAGEVVWLSDRGLAKGLRLTEAAMRRGAELIFQGVLADGGAWHGYTDFLVRVEQGSALGAWSYEVQDTKLARSLKAKFAVQLALYAELVALVQGADPPALRVVLGDGKVATLRVGDYRYYVRHAMRRLEAAIARGGPDDPGPATAAEPCAACGECGWQERCDTEWEEEDHLYRVANIRTSQIASLRETGVDTLAALAALPPETRVPGIAPEVLERLREQAALQHEVRDDPEARRCVLLDPGPGRGLARLPRPDPQDLFFDMEGDPLYPDGGLEYLFGVEGPEGFRAFWALDAAEEKRAFEAFIDHAAAVMAANPAARIYHYNHYETTALKRLAQRHATREAVLDGMLRERRFVDLYVVVREGLRISEPRYSLKNVERFYRPARDGAVGTAGDSIVAFERWLEVRDQAILDGIEVYNRDDCVSTRELRDWLISLRPQDLPWVEGVQEDEDPDRKARREAEEAGAEAIRERLVEGAPEGERPFRELVAHLASFHRREQKPAWWAMFDRQNRDAEELTEDADCLGGLEAVGEPFPIKRSIGREYRFPRQDTKLRAGSGALDAATLQPLAIDQLDEKTRRVVLKRGKDKEPLPDRLSIAPGGPINDGVLRDAVRRFADSVAAGEERFPALAALLRRDPPRLSGRKPGEPIRRSGETTLGAAVAACRDLVGSHLFVQGPPGTGKTWTASRMILNAIQRGLRVGVSALSHKAIVNLLRGVEAAAKEAGVTIRGYKKSDRDSVDNHVAGTMITDIFDNEVPANFQLIAGTAWLFARQENEGLVDLLFIDEAGQVSLANLVAAGTAARSLVLVGDQMQLGQPIQGSHPGDSGTSVLEYLLQGAAVVPPERGIFLGESYRMHPDLCSWVSEAIYDGGLTAHASCSQQTLLLGRDFHPSLAPYGLRFREVMHEGCSQRSDEEVAEVSAIWHDLMRQHWCDRHGNKRPMTAEDVLVVAPWNVQVNALRSALPAGARVGTVDRFQGQEAAVVLVSMATSAAEDIPRGISFLFNRERLNVAVSRAHCLAVVLASPKLLEVPCATVEDLRLVNTLCHAHAAG